VAGVEGDDFDGLERGFGLAGALGGCVGGAVSGQIERGDLQAVEHEAGAAWLDDVAGEAAEDFADAGLDGGAVFGEREVEVGAEPGAAAGPGCGAAGVVIEAEVFAAEAEGAAAMAVGEDVAALEALDSFEGFGGFGLGGFGLDGFGLDVCGHGWGGSHPRGFGCKVFHRLRLRFDLGWPGNG
jgi:hypothetical protein